MHEYFNPELLTVAEISEYEDNSFTLKLQPMTLEYKRYLSNWHPYIEVRAFLKNEEFSVLLHRTPVCEDGKAFWYRVDDLRFEARIKSQYRSLKVVQAELKESLK